MADEYIDILRESVSAAIAALHDASREADIYPDDFSLERAVMDAREHLELQEFLLAEAEAELSDLCNDDPERTCPECGEQGKDYSFYGVEECDDCADARNDRQIAEYDGW